MVDDIGRDAERPEGDDATRAELRSGGAARAGAGLALTAAAIVCLLAGPLPLLVFAIVLAIVAAGELFRLSRARGALPVPLAGFAGVAGLFVVAYLKGQRAPVFFPAVVGATAGLAFLAMLARRGRRDVTAGIAWTLFVTLYVGLFGAYFIALRRSPDGFRLALAFLAMVALHDAGSYLLGRARGRTPIAPAVSPDKTWEGWLGGTALMLAGVALVATRLDPPFTWTIALALAGLMAIAIPLGDVCESMVKRDPAAGTQPGGGPLKAAAAGRPAAKGLPAHGGALDRIDSALFAAPVFFYAYRVLAL